MTDTAKSRFTTLHNKRSGLITRCEEYSALTVPSVCPPDNYSAESDEVSEMIHSIGSQMVNNLVNKMMLALFAPTRPFFKLSLPARIMQEAMEATGLSEIQITEETAVIEKELVEYLDELKARPKLYDLFMHLVVTGNAVRVMDASGEDEVRIVGIKDFVSRRSNSGKLLELIIKEDVYFDDLNDIIKEHAARRSGTEDDTVTVYRWFKWDGSHYVETQYVDDNLIADKKYQGRYKPEDMPATHHVWRITGKSNYGIGHVEDNAADFRGLNDLTEAEVNGAILASEFRWLANPGGITSPDDVMASGNGDVIPGSKGDLELVSAAGMGPALQVVSASADKYVRRLGSAFLLAQTIQRDAERVTAEEIRILANELETGLGGVYSRLAIDVQYPLANWLMRNYKATSKVFNGTDIKAVIVTGLDALSRNGDLDNVRLFLQDVAQVTALPPEVTDYLKLDNIYSALATGRGISSSNFVKTQEEVNQERQQRMQQMQQAEQQSMAAEQQIKGE